MPGQGKPGSELDPSLGEHSHGSQGYGRKPNAAPAQFQIALTKMNIARAAAVVAQTAASQRQKQGGIHTYIRGCDFSDKPEQLFIIIGDSGLHLLASQDADTRG